MSELDLVDKLLRPDDDSDEEPEDEDQDEPAHLPRFRRFSETITCLKDICDFLEDRGPL